VGIKWAFGTKIDLVTIHVSTSVLNRYKEFAMDNNEVPQIKNWRIVLDDTQENANLKQK
jgi:hypothetical protein